MQCVNHIKLVFHGLHLVILLVLVLFVHGLQPAVHLGDVRVSHIVRLGGGALPRRDGAAPATARALRAASLPVRPRGDRQGGSGSAAHAGRRGGGGVALRVT